jgi:RNAse (barnase) inhibitor barstar
MKTFRIIAHTSDKKHSTLLEAENIIEALVRAKEYFAIKLNINVKKIKIIKIIHII